MPRWLAVALLLVLAEVAEGARARRARRPSPGPREPVPTVGDALDIHADNEYIGKDNQAVCVITPGSANRRIVTTNGTMVGMRRRRGLITWIKKKDDYWPWEKPWDDPMRAPFKVRFLKMDPAGIAMSMVKEERLAIAHGRDKKSGRNIIGVGLVKPKAWWKFWE